MYGFWVRMSEGKDRQGVLTSANAHHEGQDDDLAPDTQVRGEGHVLLFLAANAQAHVAVPFSRNGFERWAVVSERWQA
jgi:hypothetical protein